MKKILSLCVAALAAITMTAQDIAVNIKLTAQSGGESTLLLASGTGVSSADNATLVAPLTNSDNVAIYVQGDERYSIYATDGSFVNLPIAFITDRMGAASQSYTLHFEDVLAGTGSGVLKLKDLVTGDEFTIVDGGTYNFVVNTTNAPNYVAGTNTVIADRFIINYDPTQMGYTVNLNAYGMATFSAAEKTVIPAGLKAYKAGDLSGDVLTLTEVAAEGGVIPANTGVLLYGEQSGNPYNLAVSTADAADFSGNKFHAATEWNASLENVYILHGNELWQFTGTEFAPNKAYLQIEMPAGTSYAPHRIRLRYDAATGVENVESAVKAEKFMENGQVLIKRGDAVYNLQGQVVK